MLQKYCIFRLEAQQPLIRVTLTMLMAVMSTLVLPMMKLVLLNVAVWVVTILRGARAGYDW